MRNNLEGKRIAILATDGFEQSELVSPRDELAGCGATVHVIAPQGSSIRGWQHTDWGDSVPVDRTLDQVRPDQYDVLVLPGGVMNPDKLRVMPEVRAFVSAFSRANKPIAAICHGPWTLIDAGLVEGRRMTSYPSIRADLENAGARWVDEEVVVDGNLVTSRKPDDLPAFNRTIVKLLAPDAREVHA